MQGGAGEVWDDGGQQYWAAAPRIVANQELHPTCPDAVGADLGVLRQQGKSAARLAPLQLSLQQVPIRLNRGSSIFGEGMGPAGSLAPGQQGLQAHTCAS
jgi:hypothetical protein